MVSKKMMTKKGGLKAHQCKGDKKYRLKNS